jgi:peptidoglycan/xylan/chitin deacetylase (PgdA/CDA1 family)
MLRNFLTKLARIAKEIIGITIRYSGILFIIRNSYAKRKVAIIVYHDPQPDILDKHLTYLSKRYNYITLDKLVNAIYSQHWEDIPPKSLIITLDDGHKGNFQLVEIFQKHKVTPTIYLCSQLIDTNRHFWFKEKNITSRHYKRLKNNVRLHLLNKQIAFSPKKEFQDHERQSLNKKEIIAMKNFVSFQSHSAFHPVLTTCTFNECKEEIFRSKKDIETMIGNDCTHFSYPNGDYTEREIALLKEAGYLSSRTTDIGWNHLNTDPFKLRILGVSDNISVNWFTAELTGLPIYMKHLFNRVLYSKYALIQSEGIINSTLSNQFDDS